MPSNKFVVDFDSAYTNIYKIGSGLVLSEPTVAVVSSETKDKVQYIGLEASKLIGKTVKNSKIVFPVFEGEIVNEKVASGLLLGFLEKVGFRNKLLFGDTLLFGVPCGSTYDILKKYYNVAKACGASKVYFVESPILSALGQRIPFSESKPCFVIDMTGGTTNIAAVSLDGVIAGVSVNLGGNKISADIIDEIENKYGLQIGLQSADKLKNEIGSLDKEDLLSAPVNGRDIKTGAPRSVSIKASDINEPISKYFDKIAEIANSVLNKLPPEVSAEIRRSGIYVSGGASKIFGLERYYQDKFDMKINVAQEGLYSVALGGGIVLADNALLKKVAIDLT